MSPSYRIVFYVSGHGFGHTSRSVEVIEALVRVRPDVEVTVKTSAPRRLFERTLSVEVVPLECDAGMAQIDSLNVDVRESVRKALAFQAQLPALAAREARDLEARKAAVVVGDIPPLAFAAAHLAGLPSVAIGNFSWDWIYEAYPDEGTRELAQDIRAQYALATEVLRLPMTGGFEGLDAIARDIPFIARRSRRRREDVRRALGLDSQTAQKPFVLMSFGGYGITGLDAGAVAALDRYVIATTDSPSGTNAIDRTSGLLHLSEQQIYSQGLRYEDLVCGADVVVTKPGYGIISEAIANGAALVYTSRGHFVEYDLLVREMPRYLRARFIERDDLLKGNWKPALDAVLAQPAPPETPRLDGAQVAADAILRHFRQLPDS